LPGLTEGCSRVDSRNSQEASGAGTDVPNSVPATVANEQFRAYWNQGKAELTRYALEQARYGEIRHGDAVLVFVTEDFLTDKEVKLESPPGDRRVSPVLKLNLV